ncbi:MAG: hypothetical protein JWM73_2068, partial [Solirubrobacterales bacterium]|nr:hypothetical protein [Solirubrobacterales bacterium]
PLAAGARCERAELLLSDRLDAPLPRQERKWLEIHQARCPRCTEHEALLGAARAELRATFVAEPPPMLPPAPAPPALPAAKERLRVVPPPPEPEALGRIVSPTGTEDGPTVAEAETRAPEAAAAPAPPTPSSPPTPSLPAVPPARAETSALPRGPSPAVKRAAKVLALLLVLAGLVAAAAAGISALSDDTPPSAPWDAPDVHEVHPAPLTDQ